MNYWEEYYKTHSHDKPSHFAIGIADKFKTAINHAVVDIGAGDFRDSKHFAGNGFAVTAVEPNNHLDSKNINHIKSTAEEFFKTNKEYFGIGYARWFIHSVDKDVESSFIRWASDNCCYLCLEFRREDDVSFKDDHFRRTINNNELLNKLSSKAFNLVEFQSGNGLSIVGDDDPLLTRMILENSVLSNIMYAKHISKMFGIDLILDGGSLLGYWRHGRAIKGDYDDVDLVAFYKDWDKSDKMIKAFEEVGFKLFRKRETMFTVRRGASKIDIFFVKEEGDNYYITLYWQKRPFALQIPKKYYDNLQDVIYYHTKLKAPKDIDGYLTHRFGNWRKPILRPAFTFQNYIDTPNLTRWL